MSGPSEGGPGPADTEDAADVRTRILAGAVAEAGDSGLGRLTVEGVARRAGVGRATVYRHFPGGRDQLTAEAVTWEVARYFAALLGRLEGVDDVATRLERGIAEGRALLAEHQVFQKVVDTEPERLLPHLSQSAPLVQAAVRDDIRPRLEAAELVDGADPAEAADFLARNVLSLLMAEGGWDLDDPAEVRRLVRANLLAGVLAHP
ncbi:TetR/AcrR family transcriptional regulator [Iamia majanohamensis]|uniref:TetR/AcrR family transcriptional regulator n=1 Tax=Iamia majanohamensis TaxID=467976 RepID=A0AAF0BSK3_9ACTN|nr:TetR/AcrR family transcriptional regulator [Iamia majanohamensis]WCO65392.1 TetR/AcrR family transcriptional regulator [Iamia majanohamensis]